MGKRVTIDNFAKEISKILEDYQNDVDDAVNASTRDVAKLGVRALNNASGAAFGGKKYRRSWTQQTRLGRLRNSAVLYSNMPGLPHLLEHGHVKRGGKGRVDGKAHIAPVEQIINETYEREVIDRIEKA